MHDATSPLNVRVRWMIRRDMEEVLEIERNASKSPWLEAEFIGCLRQRNCIGMVAEHAERVVGFMVYELFDAHIYLINFAVAADVRRRGVGRRMLEKLIGRLSSQHRTRVTLEVHETHLTAQLFLRSCGFRAVGVLHEFYEDSQEDAYRMQFALKTPLASV